VGDGVSGLKGTSAVLPSGVPEAAAREHRDLQPGSRARLLALLQADQGQGGGGFPGVGSEGVNVKGRASIKPNVSAFLPALGRGARLRQRARGAGALGGRRREKTTGTAPPVWVGS
jgi:hypothetical protein